MFSASEVFFLKRSGVFLFRKCERDTVITLTYEQTWRHLPVNCVRWGSCRSFDAVSSSLQRLIRGGHWKRAILDNLKMFFIAAFFVLGTLTSVGSGKFHFFLTINVYKRILNDTERKTVTKDKAVLSFYFLIFIFWLVSKGFAPLPH